VTEFPVKKNHNKIYLCVQVLSVVIAAFLFWVIYSDHGLVVNDGHWSKSLPLINATLNTLTACLLIFGLIQIKKGHKETHIKIMLSATLVSTLFLISYVTYHFYQGDTKFLQVGLIRSLYFFILISHILLSIINLPLILLTLWFAFQKNYDLHKKFARITFPIWLYVSISGVLVYFFLNIIQ
jgi:putative membrane protein